MALKYLKLNNYATECSGTLVCSQSSSSPTAGRPLLRQEDVFVLRPLWSNPFRREYLLCNSNISGSRSNERYRAIILRINRRG